MFSRIFLKLFFMISTISLVKTDTINIQPLPVNFTAEIPFQLWPKIEIAFFIRNKAHCLPYFLGNLERFNYPKKNIGLFIRLDHSEDNSSHIIKEWLSHMQSFYHHVDYKIDNENQRFEGQELVTKWSKARFEHIINLRNEALESARNSWSDYLFMIDVDVMIINENVVQDLIYHNVPIISPLLNCTNSDSYSNFWGDINEMGYYKRSEDYFDIQQRRTVGIFKVPMINTVYFINVNLPVTLNLTFSPSNNNSYPIDDVILFAKSAEQNNASMYIDNSRFYGYFSVPNEENGLLREIEIFNHVKFQIMLDRDDEVIYFLKPSVHLSEMLPPKSKFGFDEIYLINLKRRPYRRIKMEYLFDQLGIDVKYFEAVDGTMLNKSYLDSLKIKQLPGYSDPYHKRDLKMGEIGCFLSHYYIWKEMIKNKYEKILIFEDDVRFGPGFQRGLTTILNEAEILKPDWELLYLGRKRMSDKEIFLSPASHLVYPDYTYWTLSYIINKKGVRKLLAQDPLMKILAVDEFLPIMFDRHPQDDWKMYFSPRNLIAISAEPLLLEPARYTGEPRYISDTEDSEIIQTLK